MLSHNLKKVALNESSFGERFRTLFEDLKLFHSKVHSLEYLDAVRCKGGLVPHITVDKAMQEQKLIDTLMQHDLEFVPKSAKWGYRESHKLLSEIIKQQGNTANWRFNARAVGKLVVVPELAHFGRDKVIQKATAYGFDYEH